MIAFRAFLATVLLTACTTIGTDPPPIGWPTLAVTKHYVSQKEMRDQCSRWISGLFDACAVVNLKNETCDIWINAEVADAELMRHEETHCKGYDHAGATDLRDLFANYQGKK